MLKDKALSNFRIRSLGAARSGVAESQLTVLSAYRDRPDRSSREMVLNGLGAFCELCPSAPPSKSPIAPNERFCELNAKRLGPQSGEVNTVFMIGRSGFFCKTCLRKELLALRKRLDEIDFFEICLLLQRSSIVMTTEAEVDEVLSALRD